MSTLPYFLNWLDPWVELNKDLLLTLGNYTGMPWYTLYKLII